MRTLYARTQLKNLRLDTQSWIKKTEKEIWTKMRKPKTVSYNTLSPFSDKLAWHNGKFYMTKQDLKRFPNKVTLVMVRK